RSLDVALAEDDAGGVLTRSHRESDGLSGAAEDGDPEPHRKPRQGPAQAPVTEIGAHPLEAEVAPLAGDPLVGPRAHDPGCVWPDSLPGGISLAGLPARQDAG